MNPAGLTSCRYDNLQISVGDVFDGKWLYSSAACATPVNGVYSHSWHHTNNSSGSFANRINNLAIGSYLYLGHGAERFNNPAVPGHINGDFTDNNVYRVCRITWQLFSLTIKM